MEKKTETVDKFGIPPIKQLNANGNIVKKADSLIISITLISHNLLKTLCYSYECYPKPN